MGVSIDMDVWVFMGKYVGVIMDVCPYPRVGLGMALRKIDHEKKIVSSPKTYIC